MTSDKIVTLSKSLQLRDQLKSLNKKIVLTNGCFDILHIGHIVSLQKMKQFGGELWIILNSDSSIKKLKGDSRPINHENDRAYFLASLSCVDKVIISDSVRLDKEINLLYPDVYCKSGDYSIDTIDEDEKRELQNVGAEIKFVEFLGGYSTTELIRKIKSAY